MLILWIFLLTNSTKKSIEKEHKKIEMKILISEIDFFLGRGRFGL